MTGLLSSAGVAGHVGRPGTLAASPIAAPHIEYSQLAPMLIVFGAALAAVLVEAFAPRASPPRPASRAGPRQPRRGLHPHHCHRRVRHHLRERRRGARGGHGRGGRGPAHPVHPGHDPDSRFRQRPDHRRRRAWPQPLRGAGGGRPRQRRGTRRPAEGGHAHRDLPADPVRGRRHAAVPRGQRPAHAVRGARGAVAAALPAVRAGPPPPAAVPGSGGEVLPARGLLLGVPPVRHRPAVRVHGLGGAGAPSPRRPRPTPPTRRCCWPGWRCSASACCSRSAPCRSRAGSRTCTRARPPRSPP